ncbi:MAG: holo-ACP synthase [Chloroflexota bacterium]
MKITSGVDLIEIERIDRAVKRFGDRFLRRVYTDEELSYCRGRAQNLAGRFAAKEAASKALGVGIRTLRWKDIETVRHPSGKPLLRLHGKAAAIARHRSLEHFEVSITHSRSEALATVIAWSSEG